MDKGISKAGIEVAAQSVATDVAVTGAVTIVTAGIGGLIAPRILESTVNEGAKFGQATSNKYKATFFAANPGLKG